MKRLHCSLMFFIGAVAFGGHWLLPWASGTGSGIDDPQLETEVLTALGINWERPWAPTDELAGIDASAPINAERWAALFREAGDAWSELPDRAMDGFLSSHQLERKRISRIAESRNLSESDVLGIVRKHVAVLERAEKWGTQQIDVSEEEVDQFIRKTQQRLEMQMVILPNQDIASSLPSPDEPELLAIFDRRQSPDCAEEPYKVPGAVHVQFFSISRRNIARGIEPGEEALRAYWKKHHDSFPDSDEFEEVRSVVTEAFRQARAIELGSQAADALRSCLEAPWHEAEINDNTFAVAPEEVRSDDYLKSVAHDVSERLGVPIQVIDVGFVTLHDLDRIEGIGRAVWERNEKSNVSFANVAFHVERIYRWKPAAESSDWALALYEPSPVLLERTMEGTVGWYVARVADVAEPVEATDLALVRNQVERDWREQEAHDRVRDWANRLAARARQTGLKDAWTESDELRSELGEMARFVSPSPFTLREPTGPFEFEKLRIASKRSTVPQMPDEPGFLERCFDHCEKVLTDGTGAGQSIAIIELKKRGGYAVVQPIRLHPIPDVPEEYRAHVRQRLRVEEFYRELRHYFAVRPITQPDAAER